MQLPSIEEVNETRLNRFDDQITAALQNPQLGFFRDVVNHYVKEYDVPEVDVAAALAIAMQGDTPLLMEPEPEPERRPRREDRFDRDGGRGTRGDRGDRPERRARTSGQPLASYKIQVGKRHRVEPRQIVGAIANEGGLDRRDFGRITIRGDYSVVELPAKLPDGAWEKLKETRISGKLIELSKDYGPPKKRGFDGERGERRDHRKRD